MVSKVTLDIFYQANLEINNFTFFESNFFLIKNLNNVSFDYIAQQSSYRPKIVIF